MNVATADSRQRQARGTHGSQELADIFESFSITSKPWKTDLSNLGMAWVGASLSMCTGISLHVYNNVLLTGPKLVKNKHIRFSFIM